MCQTASEEEIDYIFATEYNAVGALHWYPVVEKQLYFATETA